MSKYEVVCFFCKIFLSQTEIPEIAMQKNGLINFQHNSCSILLAHPALNFNIKELRELRFLAEWSSQSGQENLADQYRNWGYTIPVLRFLIHNQVREVSMNFVVEFLMRFNSPANTSITYVRSKSAHVSRAIRGAYEFFGPLNIMNKTH